MAEPLRAGARPPAAYTRSAWDRKGARRGLRGGPPVLAAADRAYLAAEWSGSADRRAAKGRYASIAA